MVPQLLVFPRRTSLGRGGPHLHLHLTIWIVCKRVFIKTGKVVEELRRKDAVCAHVCVCTCVFVCVRVHECAELRGREAG